MVSVKHAVNVTRNLSIPGTQDAGNVVKVELLEILKRDYIEKILITSP